MNYALERPVGPLGPLRGNPLSEATGLDSNIGEGYSKFWGFVTVVGRCGTPPWNRSCFPKRSAQESWNRLATLQVRLNCLVRHVIRLEPCKE